MPPKPTNITVNRINDTAMIVRWSLIGITEANGHILGYIITYTRDTSRRRQATMFETVGPDVNELTVNNLISGVSYTVTVSANTGAGDGESSDTIMLSSSQQSSMYMYCILLVLIVLIELYCLFL